MTIVAIFFWAFGVFAWIMAIRHLQAAEKRDANARLILDRSEATLSEAEVLHDEVEILHEDVMRMLEDG